MPTYCLVPISGEVTVTGGIPPTFPITPGSSLIEAIVARGDGKNVSLVITNYPEMAAVEAGESWSTYLRAFSTSLLIKLGTDFTAASVAEPEPIPSGFLVTSARICAYPGTSGMGFNISQAEYSTVTTLFYDGSFHPATTIDVNGIFPEELSLNLPIFLSTYGVKMEFTLGTLDFDQTGFGTELFLGVDFFTITGDYLLWSTSLDIQPKFQVIPNVTPIIISDGEGLLNTVDEIVTEYLDTDGETIISNTIPAVDFISQTDEEIVFLVEETLPGDIPDCTLVTVSLVDELGQRVHVGVLKTECPTEPDIEIPDPDETPTEDPETNLLLGLGYGGIHLRGSAFENDMAIIYPEIDGGLDFGGSVGNSLRLMGNVSGIYTLIPGQTHDRLYDRLPEQEFIDVKIPDPFVKTGFIKK